MLFSSRFSQVFDDLSCATYEEYATNINEALGGIVASLLDNQVSSSDVVFSSYSSSASSSRRLQATALKSQDPGSSSSSSSSSSSDSHSLQHPSHTETDHVVTVAESSCTLTYTVGYADTLDYNTLATELEEAVDDGEFTEDIDELAQEEGATFLEDVSTSQITIYQVSSAPTATIATAAPTAEPSEETTSEPSPFPTFSAGSPTAEPTAEPSEEVTSSPTPTSWTPAPTSLATAAPSVSPVSFFTAVQVSCHLCIFDCICICICI